MSIEVECDCGRLIRVKDEAGGKRVKCPECHAVVRVPVARASPDFEVVEDEPGEPRPALRKSVKAVAEPVEGDEEEQPREKRKKVTKKRKKRAASDADDDTSPFWRSRTGLILNGLGLIGLGAGGIGLYWFTNDREAGILIAGILCIGFGIGGVITGLTKSTDGSRRRSRRRDEDEDEE